MEVNGFALPPDFVQLCEAIERGEAPDEWELKEDVDAYGQPWGVADLRIKCEPECLEIDTDWVSNAFLHEGGYQQLPLWDDQPGFIADFAGVSNFVCFADTTDGSTYAFDFGTDHKEPSIVYWGGGYWQRVAPNFAEFMALFVEEREAPQDPEEDDSEWVQPNARELLTAWASQFVVGGATESRPDSFVQLADQYAVLSPEERQEVETEVREELERWGMTDEQRRALDRLWAQLRTTNDAIIAMIGDWSGNAARPTPQSFLAKWVKYIVVSDWEEGRYLLELMASFSPEMSPKDRGEIEAEVREARERWRMTDEQRQRLDDVRTSYGAVLPW